MTADNHCNIIHQNTSIIHNNQYDNVIHSINALNQLVQHTFTYTTTHVPLTIELSTITTLSELYNQLLYIVHSSSDDVNITDINNQYILQQLLNSNTTEINSKLNMLIKLYNTTCNIQQHNTSTSIVQQHHEQQQSVASVKLESDITIHDEISASEYKSLKPYLQYDIQYFDQYENDIVHTPSTPTSIWTVQCLAVLHYCVDIIDLPPNTSTALRCKLASLQLGVLGHPVHHMHVIQHGSNM